MGGKQGNKNKSKTKKLTNGQLSQAQLQRAKMQRSKKVPAFVLAQVDPFNEDVSGAKIPDRNSLPSVTQRFRGVFTATTDANGNYATAFRPYAAAGQYLPLSVSSAPAITWAGGTAVNLTPYASMLAQYTTVRTVGYGLRIKFVGARTASSGRLHVACVANNYDSDGYGYTYFPTTPSQFENCPWYANYALNEITEQEIVVPGRRSDEASFRYRHPLAVPSSSGSPASGSIETADGWASIVLLVEGATASSGVVQIEVCYHFEANVNPSGGSLLPVSPPALPSTETLDRAMAVSGHQPIARYVEDGFNSIKKVIDSVAWGSTTAKHLIELGGGIMKALI